jgi:dUTP pyrophosphatase
MKDVSVPILLERGAKIPEYATKGAAGADLRALIESPVILKPMDRLAVPTGLRIDLPCGFEAQVRPRSGLALTKGLTCLNTPGTIDSDYRGEIKVIVINLGSKDICIEPGDRIAQLVIAPVSRAAFEPRSSITDSDRGEGGFGSTGVGEAP